MKAFNARPPSVFVFSDVICPWCYLGKRNLEKALQTTAGPGLVQYWPFELNPNTPEGGVNRTEYLGARYGPALKDAEERLKTLGREAGIEYNFDRADFIPNTRKAHRLIWFASQSHPEMDLVDRLFFSYFTLGLDIGNNAILERIATDEGLELPAGFLDSTQGNREVEELEQKASQLGVRGVPFFVLDNRLALSGAQSVAVFLEAFAQLQQDD